MQLRGDAPACEALARSFMHHTVVAVRKQISVE